MSSTKVSSVSFPTKTVGKSWTLFDNPNNPENVNTAVVTCTRTRTGSRVPHHVQMIQAGVNACSDMQATWDTLDYTRTPKISVYAYNDGNGYWGRRYNYGDVAVTNSFFRAKWKDSSVSDSFADNLARANFYKKLREIRTKVQGLTFLGELKETVRMLRRPAAGLQNLAEEYLRALRKRKRAVPKRWKKDISGLWLEYAFGWIPLMNDIEDIVKAYKELTHPTQTDHVRSFGKKEYDLTSALNGEGTGAGVSNLWLDEGLYWRIPTAKRTEEHVVRYSGSVRAQVRSDQWSNYALFGFEPTQFIPTAWELCPWSFLVDYFTNIGDLLDASVTSTSNVVYVNRTVIKKMREYRVYEHDYKRSAAVFGSGFYAKTWDSNQSWCLTTRKTVTRSKGTGIPMPTFQMSFGLNDGQLMNVAALLGQANALSPQRQPILNFDQWERRRHDLPRKIR